MTANAIIGIVIIIGILHALAIKKQSAVGKYEAYQGHHYQRDTFFDLFK